MRTLSISLFSLGFLVGCVVPPDPGYTNRLFNDPMFWQGFNMMQQNQPQQVMQPPPMINCTTIYQGRNAYTSC